MPEPTEPAAPPPATAPAAQTAAPEASTPAAAPAAAAKPDWLPDTYWDADAGTGKWEQLAKDREELGQRFANGKAAYAEAVRGEITEQVKAELDAARKKAVPEKPEAYTLAVPEGLPDGVVVLDKAPGADFAPEPGKRYIVLQDDHPMLGMWREIAHELELPQEAFLKGVAKFAAAQAATVKTPAELEAEKRAFYSALGENGVQRVAHVWGKLEAALGEQATLFDAFVSTPEQVQALEKLLGAAAGPGFSKGVPSADAMTEKDLKAMVADPRYWRERDPEFIAKVTEGFRRIYPGKAA
jgi:hypothetical protein